MWYFTHYLYICLLIYRRQIGITLHIKNYREPSLNPSQRSQLPCSTKKWESIVKVSFDVKWQKWTGSILNFHILHDLSLSADWQSTVLYKQWTDLQSAVSGRVGMVWVRLYEIGVDLCSIPVNADTHTHTHPHTHTNTQAQSVILSLAMVHLCQTMIRLKHGVLVWSFVITCISGNWQQNTKTSWTYGYR